MKKDPSRRKDHYFHKAKSESYAARAVYKLEQIDKKFHLFSPAQRVLDLGCHPGSWMQYASKRVGRSGQVVGIDRVETAPPAGNVRTIAIDIFEVTPERIGEPEQSFDVVLSDMAPNTTGIKAVDQLKSTALAERALELALAFCKAGGHFAVKIFMGPDEPKLFSAMRRRFERVVRHKPDASRSESMEGYLIGLKLKEG